MSVFRLLSGLLLGGVCLLAAAAPADWYRAEVPVRSRDDAARAAALQAGVAEVLVRLTGRSRSAADARIDGLAEAALTHVDHARYRQGGSGLELGVEFDGEALEQLLREAGYPLWTGQRPDTLFWLARRDRGAPELAEPEAAEWQSLRAAARRRGLPLVTPMGDLEERRLVSADDVWSGELERLREASARYRPDAVVIASLREDASSTWLLRARLYREDELVQSFSLAAAGRQMVLDQLVDRVADVLSQSTPPAPATASASASAPASASVAGPAPAVAPVAGVAAPVSLQPAPGPRVEVRGIGGAGDYARVLRRLERAPGVERVVPERLDGEVARFRIDHPGGIDGLREALRETLRGDAMLRHDPTGDGSTDFGEPLLGLRLRDGS